jgi:hypothetical protein
MSILSLVEAELSKPLVISISHNLGREEAARRIKSGFGKACENLASLFTIHHDTWTDYHLDFRLSALGQNAAGTINVEDDHVRLELRLPWLLAQFAKQFTPAIRKEARLMLEKK